MKKKSTLIYVVNAFNPPSVVDSVDIDKCAESYIGNMEYAEFLPSAKTIRNILDFAHSYEVFETESTGEVEMNLN